MHFRWNISICLMLAAALAAKQYVIAAPAPATPPTTAPTNLLKIVRNGQALLVPGIEGLEQTPDSSNDKRIITGTSGAITITVTFSLLPADEPTDPAAVASAVQAKQGALTHELGDKLLIPPESHPDPQFAMVMHWQYLADKDGKPQTVDATRRWYTTDAGTIQSDITVTSRNPAVIKVANEYVVDSLLHTKPSITAGTNVPRVKLPVGGIECTPPPHFDDVGVARGGEMHVFESDDGQTGAVLSVLRKGTPLDAAGVKVQLAAAQRTLADQKLSQAPELIPSRVTVAIRWTIDKDGSKLHTIRLIQTVGAYAVQCEMRTSGDPTAAQHIGEDILLSANTPPAPESEVTPPPPPSHPKAGSPLAQPKAPPARVTSDDEKAAGLLAMADDYATANKIDAARKKYQQIIDQYPDTSSAPKAKKRLAEMDNGAGASPKP